MKPGLTVILMLVFAAAFAQKTTGVNRFDKVIVSPHIEVTFVEGTEESVTIERNSEPDKLNIEVKNRTLRIYLDGAKEITRSEKVLNYGAGQTKPLYSGTVVTAIVTYKKLDELSLRGEETHLVKSKLDADRFMLKVYGTSKVYINEVNLGNLHTRMYGESLLEIKAGSIGDQKYTVYGESKIDVSAIEGNTSKITAYGEAEFLMNVSDEIKITSFGEASLAYKGNPRINKWLHFGEMQISKLD